MDVTIFDPSPARPDGRTAGVFYLHDSCELNYIGYPMVVTTYAGAGDRAGYAHKLYGDAFAACSWPDEVRIDSVWDGMLAMKRLWEMFGGAVEIGSLANFNQLASYFHTPPLERVDLVISTVPLDLLIGFKLPYRVATIATASCDAHISSVSYNGLVDDPVYRRSHIFGRETVEFVPGHIPEPDEQYAYHRVKKVERSAVGLALATLLDDRVLLTGRYGLWDKSCLTHNVFARVIKWLEGHIEDGTI